MRTTLIFLGCLAVVLGIFAFFAVFGSPTGSYTVNGIGETSNTPMASSSFIFASSTVSSTAFNAFSSSSSSTATSSNDQFGTAYASPALTWPEGQSHISIMAAELNGNQMTFTLTVQTGATPECIPLNLRLVADEAGDLDPPNPASFAFPDSGNCNGNAAETYENQTTTFTVDPTTLPLLFTTGGASNIFFEVATSANNGLNVVFPGTSG